MARILVAEDDLAIRDFVRLSLEMDQHEVTTSYDGTEAFERLVADPVDFDLLLTDICMPVTDGLLLAKKIIDRKMVLPILLTTAFQEKQSEVAELGEQVRGVIIKPFTLELLRKRVNAVLDEVEGSREVQIA